MTTMQNDVFSPVAHRLNAPTRFMGKTGFERRREDRVRSGVQAMIFGGSRFSECTVLDVCEHGVRIRPDRDIKRRTILFKAPGLKTRVATVRWCKDGQMGIQFHDPLDFEMLCLMC